MDSKRRVTRKPKAINLFGRSGGENQSMTPLQDETDDEKNKFGEGNLKIQKSKGNNEPEKKQQKQPAGATAEDVVRNVRQQLLVYRWGG
ncbi:hypothetical protein RUM43_009057 [Polyplax serrata]|uniref:Uncharacterized protein n=1 Tax=Polyplax serrata TaxID=468196 RepID=A0AAN8NUQ4_POLSC